MSSKTWGLNDDVRDYMRTLGIRESPAAAALRARTQQLGRVSAMQISPEQGALMALLAHSIGARRAIEVGTFTGYSALVVAEVLGPQGALVACDISEKWTSIAREYWRRAGVEDKIDLRIGPAAETLTELMHGGQLRSFDFAFIDADKQGYVKYYESCLSLVRPGAIVCLDNIFWGGAVADPSRTDDDVEALREVTKRIHEDERVDAVLVPVGDGMLVTRKRH